MNFKNSKLASMLILLGFAGFVPLSTTIASAQIGADVMPDLNGAYGGSVTTNGTRMDVTVEGGAGAVGQFDWNSFNVGKNGNVNFGFTNNSQTSLNRVLQGGGLSQIYGSLTNSCAGNASCASYAGTGKVILINPAGIMFGNGSTVDLNSFTASTFDIQNAKDLKDMTETEKAQYKLNVLNPLAKAAEFVGDQNNTSVTVDGGKFNIDKSLAFASNNVNIYKDSLIKTNLAYNYGGNSQGVGHTQNFSNVKIVTADGVNFTYLANGNISGVKAKADSEAGKNTARNITIDQANIQSGSVYIQNAGSKAGNAVKVSGSVVRGVKLVNKNNTVGERGDIYIVSAGDIDVNKSTLENLNMTKQYASDGTTEISNNTMDKDGGVIRLKAGNNVTVKETNMATAYSTGDYFTPNANGEKILGSGAGDIAITADKGNVDVDDSVILSKGDLTIAAAAKANIKNSAIQAKNLGNANLKKNIVVSGLEGVNIDKTYSESAGSTTYYSTKDTNITNNSTIYSGKELGVYGKDTTIADSALVYNGLNLIYDDNVLNNVTIKGTTGLMDKSSDKLTVKTNGKLTIDGNNLQQQGFSSTINGYDVKITMKNRGYQKAIDLESTKDTVTIKNGSDIKSNGNITVSALNNPNGEIFVENSKLSSNSDISLNQYKTHTAGTNITKDSEITANNIKIQTVGAESDIVADQDNFATLNYNRLTLNAGRDNKITGSKVGGLEIKNVDFNAGRDNHIHYNAAAPADTNVLTVSNSTFNGNNNYISSNGTTTLKDQTVLNGKYNDVAAIYDVNMNDTEVKAKDTAAPENTTTNIRAGRDLTTNGKVLKINQTKLIADSNKKMDLILAGATNRKAGIEINNSARNNGTQAPAIQGTADVELYDLKDTDVKINAADDVLAISKIKAGDLTLDKNDQFIAALTSLTADETDGVTGNTDGKAYIEVKNFGKFNLDPMETFSDYNNQPEDFTYTDHFVRGQNQDTQAGTTVDVYKKHFIEFDNNGTTEKFLLVYDKPVQGCDPAPDVDPEPFNPFLEDETSSLIEQTRLPRQLQPTTYTAPIDNNTTDPTTGIVNAAARIDVVDTDKQNQDDDQYEI